MTPRTGRARHWLPRLLSGGMAGVALFLGLIAAFALLGPLFGYSYAVVKSGSMAPAYPPGAVIVIHEVNPASVEPDDVISFRSPAGGRDEIVTHRVVAVERVEGDGLTFRTKGDANEEPDSRATPASQVQGKVIFSVPWVGYAAPMIQTKGLFFAIVVLCGGLLIVMEVWKIVRELRHSKQHSPPAG